MSAEQVRLLYANADAGIAITLVATLILGRLQWSAIPHLVILGWCLYMFLVPMARFTLGRLYWRTAPSLLETSKWGTAFTIGAGLSGAGWGAAGVLLYPEAYLVNQVFLIFILGGMMLGAASLLAARPEAFLAFIVPTGLGPAVRLVVQGDEAHLAMGLLASLFTLATLITTRRIHLTIVSSLNLRFQNRHLVEDLKTTHERLVQKNQELEMASLTDALTDLWNRRGAGQLFKREIASASRGGHPLCAMLCDLDFFKRVNDIYGHDVGDNVLASVARTTRETMRKADLCCRWGGEEFLIVLAATGVEEGTEAAERLRRAIEALEVPHGEVTIRLTMSIGFTEYQRGESVESCIRRCDELLYRAKETGRNRVVSDVVSTAVSYGTKLTGRLDMLPSPAVSVVIP
jgi:diguanylate cyclase (GGDEF)-like protein